MRLFVATEARLWRGPDGVTRAPTEGRGHQFWQRYLEAFDEVVVVARVASRSSNDGVQVDGPGIATLPLPDYHGLRGWLGAGMANRHLIRGICRGSDVAFLARLPGLVGAQLISEARRAGHPYAVEVVGDAADAVATSSLWEPAGKLMGAMSAAQMRRQCARAGAAAYVTESFLQGRYPAKRAAICSNYSSVELPDAAFRRVAPTPRLRAERIVTVANMTQAYKGHHVLLESFAMLVAAGLSVRLALVGAGPREETLRRQVRRLALGDRVAFVGRLESAEAVRDALDDADLFVLPSLTEGLPRALIEAMARRLPCVATGVGGIPELLPADWLAPPNDSKSLADLVAKALRTDPHTRAEIGAANYAVAGKYRKTDLLKRRRDFYMAVRDISANCRERNEH